MLSKFKFKNILTANTLVVAVMAVILTIGYANGVSAASNDYAKNFSDWVIDGVKAIATAVTAGISIKFISKRQFVQFSGFFVLACFVMGIIWKPSSLQNIGSKLMQIIFGT